MKLLNRQLQRQEQLNQSKDQLFTILSHDLRSSVHLLQINVTKLKTLLSRSLIKDAITLAENTEQITAATQSLLNNLLYWSLSQTGQVSYRPEKIALQPLINQVCYDFVPLAVSKNIVFHYTLADDFICTGDINSVKIIIRNLIDNAIKYTPANGMVTVFASRQENRCFISVQDTGVGMSEEVITAIFDDDSRRIQQDVYGRRSTGIGLWLVKNMIEKNDGVLNISSGKGTGTTVTITLPLHT